MEITEILRHGIVTEKSVHLQQTVRIGYEEPAPRYTFRVAREANKYQIREAVETMFPGVKVVRVNTITMPGKAKTVRNRKGMFRKEARPWKKAIVTLAPGQAITELNP